MRSNLYAFSILSAIVFVAGCKPVSDTSDETATNRYNGQNQRCSIVLPSVEKVAIASLGRMVEYAKSNGKNSMALAVSKNTITMLENMMRSSQSPIHPVAFYAAVKDFESSTDLSWASKGSSGLTYFRTRNCTSGECFGMFQVDVKLESEWRGGAFCQSDGLDLWSTTKGGADFCAAQFWWTMAQGGQKCIVLSGRGTNPCKGVGYTWGLNEVRRGRAAYVQAVQTGWESDAWAEMYKNYEACYTVKKPLAEAIDDFKKAVGLIKGEDSVSVSSAAEPLNGYALPDYLVKPEVSSIPSESPKF